MTAAAIECPDVLRGLPGWLVWKFEPDPRNPSGKPLKVPYYTAGGKRRGVQGRPEDRQQLTTFDAARAAAVRRGMDGVGFCPMPEWGITALDFDKCVVDGAVDPAVERLVAGTYAEFSPSGTGVRGFVQGALSGNRKSNRDQALGFETFHSSGFVTFTGRRLAITELTDATNTVAEPGPELLALCQERFGSAEAPDAPASASDVQPLGLSLEQLRDALDVLPRDFHYDDWLRVGMALHHETGGADEGFQLWDEWSATSGKYGGSDYGRAKWESFGRSTGRTATAHRLVRMANEHGARIEIAQLEADDFDVIAAPAAKPLKFPPLTLSQLLEQPAPRWIVRGVVPQAELMVIFGESGSGKSFLVLDLFAAVARGTPWLNQATQQGRVVYIVAEGRAGFGNRVRAYCQDRKVAVADVEPYLTIIADTPNLLQREDAGELVRSIGKAAVVVVDTFAQVTPGANENAAEDMGKALANCKAIHRATGALVVLVHHTGKDQSRGARGWSGLKAAADAELEVSKTLAGRAIRVSKQKDGEDGRLWGFELDQVVVDRNEDGDVTSCVVRETAAPVRQTIPRLGKWQRAVMFAAAEVGGTGEGATEAAVIAAAIKTEEPGPGRDRRAEYVREAIAQLVERNALEIADGLVRIA